MDTADLTRYLNTAFALRRVPLQGQHWQPSNFLPTGAPATAAAYANVLRTDAVTLGSWLTTSNGRFAAAAVHAMTPRLAQPAEQLLIEALIEVAAEQTDQRRQAVALLTAGAAVALLAASLLLISGRCDTHGSGL